MITGRWGRPSQVLLDIVVEPDGVVRGVTNPGRQDAPIRRGHFDAATGAVHLEGEYVTPDGMTMCFRIDGRLEGRTLRLAYHYGDSRGNVDVVRLEEYKPPAFTLVDTDNGPESAAIEGVALHDQNRSPESRPGSRRLKSNVPSVCMRSG
jgi:hypothetical protein